MSSLFREEAIDAQRVGWLGEVKVRRPRSFSAIVAMSVALLTALLAFGYFGEFSRKSRMTGIVVPVGGVLQVTATQAGVVAELLVQEGQSVSKGQPIARILSEHKTGEGDAVTLIAEAKRAGVAHSFS